MIEKFKSEEEKLLKVANKRIEVLQKTLITVAD